MDPQEEGTNLRIFLVMFLLIFGCVAGGILMDYVNRDRFMGWHIPQWVTTIAVAGGVLLVYILGQATLGALWIGVNLVTRRRRDEEDAAVMDHAQGYIRVLTDMQRGMNTSQQFLLREAQDARRQTPPPEPPKPIMRFDESLLADLDEYVDAETD